MMKLRETNSGGGFLYTIVITGVVNMHKNNKKRVKKFDFSENKFVRVTYEAYKILKKEKYKQGKSMAEIVNNLVIYKYGEKKKDNS